MTREFAARRPVTIKLYPSFLQHFIKSLQSSLDKVDIHNRRLAHLICSLIPAQCPFERDICLPGNRLIHIPALCKLNPVYEELAALRFRALCFLADVCGEDVSRYTTQH